MCELYSEIINSEILPIQKRGLNVQTKQKLRMILLFLNDRIMSAIFIAKDMIWLLHHDVDFFFIDNSQY